MIRQLSQGKTRVLIIATGAVSLAIFVAGCKEPEYGPKRADYAVAHTARYHPDVQRQESAATRPETTTQPADFRFGAAPAGTPILFVNGEAITVPEVLEPLYDDLAQRAKSLTEEAYRDYLVRRVSEQVAIEISRVMIYQEAVKSLPDKADEAFAKETDKIITDMINNRFGGVRARYEAYLRTVGLGMPEMKERLKRQLIVAQFLRDRFKPLIQSPSRGELLAYYRAHLDEFTTPASAEMFLIEIPLETDPKARPGSATIEQTVAARNQALAKARRAQEELESGVPFADVARQYSRGLQAARGGAVGEVSPGSMTQRYARPLEVLFTLEEGQVSEPIETVDAVFLVKCGRKTPARQASFEESQVQIINKLMDEHSDELQRKYITDLEKRAVIRRRTDFVLAVLSAAPRPPQYETASAQPPAAR